MADGIYHSFNDTRISLLQVCSDIKDVTSEMEIAINGVNDTLRCAAIEVPEMQCCQTGLTQKLDSVMEMLNRTRMKISFFGRNSCGKSTLINALLGCNVLPAGMGHITNCFVHLEGTELPDGSFMTANEPHALKPIDSLKELISALQDKHLATNSVVKVFWPKKMCSLLAHDVVMIDSPGCELNDEIDDGIKINLKDSDVFILVINAETSLTRGESEFFRKVKNDISEANVFIVINRWDLIDHDEAPDKVKNQHLEKCKDFLRSDTHASCKDEVDRKIFFLSATEKLRKTKPSTAQRERQKEFATFEETLASCALSSAFNLKCVPHINTAMDICESLSKNLDVLSIAGKQIEGKQAEMKSKHDSLIDELKRNLSSIEEEVKGTVFEFEKKVSEALTAVKKAVPSIVAKYIHPHVEDSTQLNEELTEKLKDFTTMRIRKSCEKKINKQIRLMLRKLNGLLQSCVPVTHIPEEPLGRCDINWDVENMGQLPNMTRKEKIMSYIPRVLKYGHFAVLFNINPVTTAGVLAMGGGYGLEKKLASDRQNKSNANAVKAIDDISEDYKKRLSVQVKEFLGHKLRTIQNQCYKQLRKSRTSEETELADLLRKSNLDDTVSWRVKIIHLKEQLATLKNLTPAKFYQGRSSERMYVTKYWFCVGLAIVLLYFMINSVCTFVFG